jgi:hypothetical protein
MKDEDWTPNGGPKSWIYYEPFPPGRWSRDIATITVVGQGEWQLHINHKYVATFNSWAEARDATPMMLALSKQERS